MSCNNYRPHIIVVSEDDACRQMAVKFKQWLGNNKYQGNSQIQIESYETGWGDAVQEGIRFICINSTC